MTDDAYEPLAVVLEGHFGKKLRRLPKPLQERIARDFPPLRWDALGEAQRRSLAAQLDNEHDPARATDRGHNWDFWIKYENTKQEIARWEAVATPTALDMAKRDDRLKELRERLNAMDEELKRKGGSSSIEEAGSTRTNRRRTRRDFMSAEIDEAIRNIGNSWTPDQVMRELKSYAGQGGSCISHAKANSVVWRDASGKDQELAMPALRKRLARLPPTPRNTPSTSR